MVHYLRWFHAGPGVAVVVPPRDVVAEGLDVDVAIRIQRHRCQAVEHRRVPYAGQAAQDIDYLGPVDSPRGRGGIGADALEVADHEALAHLAPIGDELRRVEDHRALLTRIGIP